MLLAETVPTMLFQPTMLRKILWRGLASATLVVLCLGFWAFCVEPRLLVVHRQEIELKHLPQELAGLTLAVISDLHVGAPHIDLETMERLVEKTNAERPDLILLCGDYVITGIRGGHFIAPEETFKILAGLRAKYGVFAVLGNHDWWWDGKRTAAAITAAGITLLENTGQRIDVGGKILRLVGIGDLMTRHDDALKAVGEKNPAETLVTFTHSPDVFPEIPTGTMLDIAGHTHGGQVWLPWLGRLVVPSRFGQHYAAGLIREGDRTRFVTTGVGTSVYPLRFAVIPEIAVLKLGPRER